MTTVDELFTILERAGSRRYGGESVNQLAHALQAGALAIEAGEPASMVVASLMHDIGHLVGDGDEGLAARGVDARHEDVGADVLEAVFGAAVAEPVRLHVPAKRWLCHAEAGYWDSLTKGSKVSMEVQGGRFSPSAADDFIARPYAAEAVRLRRYDDLAKVQGRSTPRLGEFRAWAAALRADG
ncbi:MAG: phosphohydrolase [Rhodospirillales bacterium]|nr:phosphohydrolase [Rhodospirillales bacterium]